MQDKQSGKRQMTSVVFFAVLGIAALTAAAGLIFGIWNPAEQNGRRLGNAIREFAVSAPDQSEIYLSELTDFDWNTVYSFDPYTSTEEMEQVLGFSSRNLTETVSENMVQLVFVGYDESSGKSRVVCNICGYADYLGYRADLGHYSDSDRNYMRVERGNDLFLFQTEDEIPSLTFRGYTFMGTIIQLFGSSALVQLEEETGEPITLSGDQVYITLSEEQQETAEEGMLVRVTYDGMVQETYPLGLSGQMHVELLN